jgi:hypothetical protein
VDKGKERDSDTGVSANHVRMTPCVIRREAWPKTAKVRGAQYIYFLRKFSPNVSEWLVDGWSMRASNQLPPLIDLVLGNQPPYINRMCVSIVSFVPSEEKKGTFD